MSEVEQTSKKTTSRLSRVKVGHVVSVSGKKTVSVQVETLVKHPQYGKYVRHRRKFAVHDEHGKAKLGDRVEIVTCRPCSKSKAHRIVRIVRASVA